MSDKDYSDLEKEREGKELSKTRNLATDKRLRDIHDLSMSMRPDWERINRFNDWLFVRYCNRNNLTEEQIEAVRENMDKRELFNAEIWGSHTSTDKGHLKVDIKITAEQIAEGLCVNRCNVNFACMYPGCTKLTDLLVADNKPYWELPLCLDHYNEFLAILKTKPHSKW